MFRRRFHRARLNLQTQKVRTLTDAVYEIQKFEE